MWERWGGFAQVQPWVKTFCFTLGTSNLHSTVAGCHCQLSAHTIWCYRSMYVLNLTKSNSFFRSPARDQTALYSECLTRLIHHCEAVITQEAVYWLSPPRSCFMLDNPKQSGFHDKKKKMLINPLFLFLSVIRLSCLFSSPPQFPAPDGLG